MFNLPSLPAPFRNFAQDRRGNVMVMFAGMAVGLVLMVGAAVDYTRATQFKTALQSLADASALAGASAYTSNTAQSAALGVQTAQNYWNAGLTRLPRNSGVGTPTITPSNDASGYYIQITVPASTIKTTFLSLVPSMTSISVQVAAKAKDPIVSASVDFGGWTTSAYDGNTIYWYEVPSNGSLPSPAFDSAHANQAGFNTNFHAIFTNIQQSPPATSTSFSIAAAQKIGFAFVNITGGRCPNAGCSPLTNYGSNGYGGAFNSVHVFYSQLNPTSSQAYPSVTCNASLLVNVVNPANPTPSAPSANTGSCQPATANPLAAPNCSQLGGNSYRYFWNDMGAAHDDYDFNDGVYNFSCSTAGTPNTGVILTN